MSSTTCLNCNSKLTGPFCAQCGQSRDTHRITFKHFIFHDVLHGVFHVERGMLFTAKQALRRPGIAALDYIAGKRKPYYNVFLLVLFTLGLILFLRHTYAQLEGAQYKKDFVEVNLNEASQNIDNLLSQKSKIIIFLFVPLAAINSRLLFKGKRYNLLEHAILAGMILLGILLITDIFTTVLYFNFFLKSDDFGELVGEGALFTILCYITFGYYNAFRPGLSFLGTATRIIGMFVFFAIEFMASLLLVIGYYTHWEFGDVQIMPFD